MCLFAAVVSAAVGERLTAALVILYRLALFAQRDSIVQTLLNWSATTAAPTLASLHREAAQPLVQLLGSALLALAAETLAMGLADGAHTAKAICTAQTLLAVTSSAPAAAAHAAKMLLHASTRSGSTYPSQLLHALAERAGASPEAAPALRVVLEGLKTAAAATDPESLSTMLEVSAGALAQAVAAQAELLEGDAVAPLLEALTRLAEQVPLARETLVRCLAESEGEGAPAVVQALQKLTTVA